MGIMAAVCTRQHRWIIYKSILVVTQLKFKLEGTGWYMAETNSIRVCVQTIPIHQQL
jgi:hypothetical protein